MGVVAADQLDVSVSDLGVDDLRELMRAVTETTERLQSTHQVLRSEVSRLQQELTEANRRLRRSESLAALGEMAAGIAHEIRNPLGSIRLYLQMLSEDLSADPGKRAICGKIDRAVTGLDAIVRDVLAFARDMRIALAPTTAIQVMDRALGDCAALVKAGAVRIASRPAEDLPIEVDAALLAQAVGNLVRNAIEAMMESNCSPRELDLEVHRRTERGHDGRRGERAVFAVEDTGPGIPAEVVPRMFNPFFTTRST
ncbi:MAG: sensor histidine kinase, partial [Planctomycetota bacterium]